MKKRIHKRLVLGFLCLVGLLIAFYPNISNAWNQRRADATLAEYSSLVVEQDDTRLEDMWAAAEQYNRELVGNAVPDAFMDEAIIRSTDYEQMLDVNGSGLMGEVEIPAIRVRLPIYHYTSEEVLLEGAGHLAGSSLPVGGQGSHAVISAHRGLANKAMFTDLDRLSEGNLFYLHVLGRTLAYEVDQITTVEPTETAELAIEPGADLCTLMTCTPYAVNTQRLLVRGHRVPYVESAHQDERENTAAPTTESVVNRSLCVLLGLLIAAVILAVVELADRAKRKAKRRKPCGKHLATV